MAGFNTLYKKPALSSAVKNAVNSATNAASRARTSVINGTATSNPNSGGNGSGFRGLISGGANWGNVEDTYDPNGNTPPPGYDYRGIPIGGDSTGVSASDYYDKYLQEQQNGIQTRINSAVDANNAYIPRVNQQSDQALQNAYIANQQARVNAPQAMSAMGYTGGASESTLLGLDTNYQNNRNTVETNRQNSLNDIYQNEQQIRATGDATMSEAASDYYNKLISAQQAATAQAQDQANWQSEYDMNQQQFGLTEQQYSDSKAQQAWENAYNERLLGLKTASSGSGGTSGGNTGGTGGTGGKNTSGNYNTVLTNVKRALGGSNAGSQTSWNAAINYIHSSLKQNIITQYEAQQMINQLGLE